MFLILSRKIYRDHLGRLLLNPIKSSCELLKLQQRFCKSQVPKDPCAHIAKAKEAAAAAEKKKKEKEAKAKQKKGKEKPKVDGLQRIKYWQARFQCADGLPVFLKLGTRDQILYYSTLSLSVVGLIYDFYTYITLL